MLSHIVESLVTIWRDMGGWARRLICLIFASVVIIECLQLTEIGLGENAGRMIAYIRHGLYIAIVIVLSGVYVRELTKTRKRLEAQLRQARKMEAIGTMASGVAHEFKNIIGVLLTYQYLVRNEIKDDGPVQFYLQKMGLSLERAKSLTQQVLTFSRLSSTDRAPVDLALVVQEALQFLRASLPADIEIHEQIGQTGTIVLADGTQMYQLLLNLCSNAEHAMRGRTGRLDIQLEPMVIKASPGTSQANLLPGDYVCLTVQDTGYGIPTDIRNRIFDPFFTTKVVGEGAGMGLAIVHGIVASHGGAIIVESEVGQGTTFTVYLPRCWEAVPDHTEADETLLTSHACILLVDDDVDIVSSLESALSNQGYEVVAHTKPAEALESFEREPQRFDLVMTDQTMPGMTGQYLAQAVKKSRADLPIILFSGFHDVSQMDEPWPPDVDAICTKPLLVRELFKTVQQVLSNRNG